GDNPACWGYAPLSIRRNARAVFRPRLLRRKESRMRVSTMIRISSSAEQDGANPDSGLMDRITDFGRQVEASGFPGLWIGDSLGRGRPTLDSLQVRTALAPGT